MRSKTIPVSVGVLLVAAACAQTSSAAPKDTAKTAGSAAKKAPAEKILRLGLIGLDTSHVTAFAKVLNDSTNPDHLAGARIVAAWKGGSPDVENSANRIEGYTTELTEKYGVKVVDSIPNLLKQVDAVLLTSVDGRPHLEQARPVLKARKPLFIDKPLAGNYQDAVEIGKLAKKYKTPVMSTSSMRYVPEFKAANQDPEVGKVMGATAWGPAKLEPHHPDLFWYGVHAVEILYTAMGPGCISVSRVQTEGLESVVGRWKDGRIGTMRGMRENGGVFGYGVVVFGDKGIKVFQPKETSYVPMLQEILTFFKTGKPPLELDETIEIMAFMQAADLSKEKNGAEVKLADLQVATASRPSSRVGEQP